MGEGYAARAAVEWGARSKYRRQRNACVVAKPAGAL